MSALLEPTARLPIIAMSERGGVTLDFAFAFELVEDADRPRSVIVIESNAKAPSETCPFGAQPDIGSFESCALSEKIGPLSTLKNVHQGYPLTI